MVRRETKFGRRRWLAVPLVLLAVLVGVLIAFWSWVDAQARAVVVISSVLDAPVLTPAAKAVSGEPRFADRTVAGNPALISRPGGEGPWPAVFFVNGREVARVPASELALRGRAGIRAAHDVQVEVTGFRAGPMHP